MKRIVSVLAVVIAMVLLGDTVRLFVAPPDKTMRLAADGVTVELTARPQFVLRATDCVQLSWQTENAQAVALGEALLPANGEADYCPETGLAASYDIEPDESLLGEIYSEDTKDPQLFVHYNDYLTYIHMRMPIYVLLADWLWLWRGVLAVGLVGWALPMGRRMPSFARARVPLLMTWLMLIVMSYLIVHVIFLSVGIEELSPENMRFTLARLGYIAHVPLLALILTAYSAATLALGASVVYPPTVGASSTVRLGSAFLFGQGVMALIWLVLGLMGQLHVLTVWLVLVLATAQGARLHGRQLLLDGAGVVARMARAFRVLSPMWRFVLVLVLILVGLLTLQSIIPPSVDGPMTYMLNAKVFAETASLMPIRDGSLYYYFMSGMTGELHMAALLLLHGETAARLFAWGILLAATLMLMGFADTFEVRAEGKVLLLVMWVSTTAMTVLVGDGKIDLFGGALAMAAVYWTIRLYDQPHVWLIGLFSGLTVLAKITYAPTLAVFIAMYSVYVYRGRWNELLRVWLVIALWGLVPLLFHFVRNGIVLGEPLIPFYTFSLDSVSAGDTFSLPWTDERTLRIFRVVYPLAVTYPLFVFMYGTVTPLWAGLLPALIWHRPQHARLRAVAWMAAVSLAVWILLFPTVREVRYVLVMVVLLFLPIAHVLPELLAHKMFRAVFNMMLVVLMLGTIAQELYEATQAIFFAYADTPACTSQGCVLYGAINDDAAENARVFSNYRQEFYLRGDLLLNTTTREEREALFALDPTERWNYLHEHDVTYIIDSLPGIVVQNKAVVQYYKMLVPLYPDALPDDLTLSLVTSTGKGDKIYVYRLEESGD